MKKKIEITEEEAIQYYNSSNDNGFKALLEKQFGVGFWKPKNIINQVKDFNDILRISGSKLEDILPYKNPRNKKQISQNNFAKIQLIEEVLNQGWAPDWNNHNEYKYYPYFEHKIQGGWVYCGYCDRNFSSFTAEVAYFKSPELAIFVGKTFIKEYSDFLNRY